MSIVCSICGGTGVKCSAVIDPNTRQFLEFTRNALSDGRCSQCGNVALTDPDEVKAGLDKLWTEYTARHRAAPNYTCCDIVRHGDYDGCEKAYIRMLDFYPAEHRLKETDIEQYAAAYTARIKAYREYTRQLDATLVRRLLDEERLMKVGESDGFRLKLHFDWFVILKRENERMYAPFKYAVNAYCLDNIQTFDRRYVTLEDALLHCLNGFNENANIPNRYKSIGHYLSGKS